MSNTHKVHTYYVLLHIVTEKRLLFFLVSKRDNYTRVCFSMRHIYTYVVVFRKYFPFRTRGSPFSTNRFRVLIPLQIDRSSVTLITSFFFLARSPSLAYEPREQPGVWLDGISMGHPMAIPFSNVEVARAT